MAVKTNIDMVSIMREGLSSGQGVKYKRLSDVMERGILEGTIEPGRKLPPHRVLSEIWVSLSALSAGPTANWNAWDWWSREWVTALIVRKRGMERQRDEGFRNVSEEPRHTST